MRKECSMQLNRSLMARRWGLFRNNAQAIHKHLPRTFRREDLSPVVKDNGGLTKTGPAMLTASDTDQVIFPLHTDLYQAHIVFFLEWPQSQDCTKDGPRFDTDERCRMHTARHRLTRRSDNIQVHRVLIDLSEQGRSRNGERKRGGRLAFTWNGFGPFAHGHQFRLHLQALHLLAHLSIGGKFDRL